LELKRPDASPAFFFAHNPQSPANIFEKGLELQSGKSTRQIALLAALTLFATFPAAVQAAGPAKPIPKAGNWML